MDSSSFSDIKQTYPDAELLPVSGSTCECYRVKLYGKFCEWNGGGFSLDEFRYITEKNNRADELANKGIDELR